MEYQEHTRRRMRSLDGTSFRFERTGEELFVNGMPAHISALPGGIVALDTGDKTVQVSAADFWDMVYDEFLPNKLLAGVILVQLYERSLERQHRLGVRAVRQPHGEQGGTGRQHRRGGGSQQLLRPAGRDSLDGALRGRAQSPDLEASLRAGQAPLYTRLERKGHMTQMVDRAGHDGAARPSEVLLEARRVNKIYEAEGKQPRGVRPPLVLDEVDVQIASGQFVALLGPSGSGKSTLLRILAGLLRPTSGQVFFRGVPQYGPNPHLAIVFQSFALFPWLTVLQNVELGLQAPVLTRTQRLKRLSLLSIRLG